MPRGLFRVYGRGDWHFITCSCFHRRPFLASAQRRDLFLKILEEVRRKYSFIIAGYVVMPEHFHLLLTEPKVGTPSLVMQVLKQRVSRQAQTRGTFWQPRFYDFNVGTARKHREKLRYIHRNPVKRGLIESPELWMWSSFRH